MKQLHWQNTYTGLAAFKIWFLSHAAQFKMKQRNILKLKSPESNVFHEHRRKKPKCQMVPSVCRCCTTKLHPLSSTFDRVGAAISTRPHIHQQQCFILSRKNYIFPRPPSVGKPDWSKSWISSSGYKSPIWLLNGGHAAQSRFKLRSKLGMRWISKTRT